MFSLFVVEDADKKAGSCTLKFFIVKSPFDKESAPSWFGDCEGDLHSRNISA
jgi:hypothetical protein